MIEKTTNLFCHICLKMMGMEATNSGKTCKDNRHAPKNIPTHSICAQNDCRYDSTVCQKHNKENLERQPLLRKLLEWRDMRMREMGHNRNDAVLIARAEDPAIINACEEVKGFLKASHTEVRVTLADLLKNDPDVSQECKETALVSNQSTLEFGTVEVRDRTGREAALQYALLRGENGSAMLTVFDSGATKTIILRKLIDNGDVKLISWGNKTQVKGLNDNPTTA